MDEIGAMMRDARRTIDTVKTSPLSTSAKGTLLIFDGDCGFCTTTVEWLRKNLPAMPAAEPWQFVDLEHWGLSEAEAAERVWLVTPTRQYGGHLAVSALLRHQPTAGLRFLGWVLRTPPFSILAALGYSLTARYRHRLPGGTPACQMRPAP